MPNEEIVQRFISAQQALPFTYVEVGATKMSPPSGYTVDHNRQMLGHGEATFTRAVSALRSWKQFDLGWVRIRPDDAPIAIGTTVAVQAKTFGFWTLNACRIVYLLEDDANLKARFGFAYGTLPAHAECGEERFSIELHQDNSVWYDLYAFSRPQYPLVKLGHPYVRGLQKRFARESMAAMVLAVRGD